VVGLSASDSGNLPVQLTRFFGRDAETAELDELLAHQRLVTVTGAPGCGKSRLGIELGRRVMARFGDGVWLVELSPVADPGHVPSAVGAVLEIAEGGGRSMADALTSALADREVLLILDNCEHVVDAAAELAGRLVQECPAVRIVATSRLPLGLPGEQVWAVAPLGCEPAIDLFVDRARLASSDFRVDDASRAQFVRICRQLDGLPLAIELAAAWTRVLSPAQIADRLDDASALLATAGRTASPRQQTMEATVEWSFRLLAPDAQQLFARLSVFVGGFDLAAAQEVAGADGDVLAALTALVDHSLVQREPAGDESMRFRLLEPLRQYAALRLAAAGERQSIRRRHAEHFLDVARRCDGELRGDGRLAALRRMEQDEGNSFAALDWALTQPSDLSLRLGAALGQSWEVRGPVTQYRSYMQALLALDTSDHRLRATILSRAARLAWRQQDHRQARALLEESLASIRGFGDDLAVARRLRSLSLVALFEGDGESAADLGERAIALFRSHGDERGAALALIQLGWARYFAGDVDIGDGSMREAVSSSRRLGFGPGIALGLQGLTHGAQLRGDATSARAHFVDALAAVRDAGMSGGEPSWLWAGAVLAADEGRFDAALRLVGGAEAMGRIRGSGLEREVFRPLRPRLDRAFDAVEPGAARRLVAEGPKMSLEALVAEAVAEPGLVGDDRLSPREREVVELIGWGMTNGEIAERLFISKRTVESHVDHIKQKLGHGSRSQVIAWALRDSPDPVRP
jgi:predicted ATPase/DNA-binding CsgD family transcriptional regulator